MEIIMLNAPFTSNKHRNTKFEEIEKMKQKETMLRNLVVSRDPEAIIVAQNLRTLFTPVAVQLIKSDKARVGMVVPTVFCYGPSGIHERKYLAKRFHVAMIITNHNARKPNFSADTTIAESIIILHKKTNLPTEFISLRKRPNNDDELKYLLNISGKHDLYRSYFQSREKMEAGDWRPCLFYDQSLYDATLKLEERTVKISKKYLIGGAANRSCDYYKKIDKKEDYLKSDKKIFWSRSSNIRKTLQSYPDQYVNINPGYEKQSARDDIRKGNLLLPGRLDTLLARVTAIYSPIPSNAFQWVPVVAAGQGQNSFLQDEPAPISKDESKSLCAWFNSSFGMLSFLTNRSKVTLTNANFAHSHTKSLRIPDFSKHDSTHLLRAFNYAKNFEMRAWKYASQDSIRTLLDSAAEECLGIDHEEVRQIKYKISQEPTIMG